jgi:hypothetical protein
MKMTSRLGLASLVVALSIATAVGCAKPTPNNGTSTGAAGHAGGGATTGAGGTSTSGTGAGGTSTNATGAAGATGTGTGTGATTGTGTGAAGTTGTATGTAGTTGTASGTGGTTGTGAAGAGGAAVVKDCATKTTVMNPIFMNFENYNGMVTADNYATAFGGTTVNSGSAYAGIYGYPEADGTTAPTMSILAGHPPSTWAGSEQLAATIYGMGGGVWMGCADASAYKGISFWVRGTSGKGTFQFSVSMENTQLPSGTNNAGGGTCPGVAASPGVNATCVDPTMTNIPLTQDWTQVTIMWSDFTPGLSGTTSVVPNGNNIVGMAWSVPLNFQPNPTAPADAGYVPVPETLVFNIDDITFIQ